MAKERRRDYTNIHNDLKFEKILMTIIVLLMGFVAYILKDMHSDFKQVVKTASQNQTELHAHIHDQRAHLPFKRRRYANPD